MRQPTPSAAEVRTERRAGRVLAGVLFAGLLLRMLGIGWGLPSGVIPGEPPFHPDEMAPWDEGGTLYTAPDPITFTWGGAFYFRLAWLVRAIGEGLHPANAIAATVFTITWLRLINVAVGVASGYAVYRAGEAAFGRRAGLVAALLFLTFPAHVLECHYARPDVVQLGFTCAAAWCAAAIAARRVASTWRASLLGGVLAGLAIATMLWGVLALVALAAAVIVAEWSGAFDARYVKRVLGIGAAIGVAAFAGYLLGSVETFVFWDMFLNGRKRAAMMHGASHYHAPLALLFGTALYAFGSGGALAGYAGAITAAARTRARPAGWIAVAPLAAGMVLLGMLDGNMMRYVLFLAPWIALLGGAVIDGAVERVAERAGAAARVRAAVYALVTVTALQVPLAWVLAMHFLEDARYQTGRWVARHATGGATVAITPGFYGDWTYIARFPEGPLGGRLTVDELQLRSNFDASGYLARGLDFITLSDATATSVSGDTAPAFVRELTSGDRYRAVASFGPPWEPLSLPRHLGAEMPGDLLYVRQTFTIYERADRASAG